MGWKARRLTGAALVLAGALAASAAGRGQPPPAEILPPPRPINGTSGPPALREVGICADVVVLPITFDAALRLAQTNNLDIAQARQVVAQAQALLERARVQVLPNATFFTSYVDHEGRIQQAIGNILNTNRNSLWVAAGPSLSFSFAEAIFAPLAARQLVAATQAGSQRVTNDTLLAVAEAYFNILRARRRIAQLDATLEFLTSEERTASRGGSKGLLPLVRDIVEVGGKDAFRSDLARVEVEVLRRQQERVLAYQEFRVAAADLSRLLHLDPIVLLWPVEDFTVPLPLPGSEWLHRTDEELTAVALANRPELAENRALVRLALERVRLARTRPLLPNVVMNYTAGGFGGSPNFLKKNPESGQGQTQELGRSGRIEDFGSRSDFDINVFLRFQNLGLGNQAEVREQKALYEQALLRQMQAYDRVVTQVVQANEQVERGEQRYAITRAALFNERGEPTGPVFQSLRLNFERVRGGEGRPLEVQDSIRGLNDLLDAYGQATTDFERARFRLLIALGLPPLLLSAGRPDGDCAPNR
ncbi:MAG TPA: TolC family protein [Gemmataceae bacterium]|nr:TolC family protein [Gemmataceae bacterium]